MAIQDRLTLERVADLLRHRRKVSALCRDGSTAKDSVPQKSSPSSGAGPRSSPLVLQSGSIVAPGADVQRRTMRLTTPGLARGSTQTLHTAIQLLLPGETAPAHRHTPTAIRWILKGTGAYTTVNGDKCWMEPGDLVLTPSWTWHDHANEGDRAHDLDGWPRHPLGPLPQGQLLRAVPRRPAAHRGHRHLCPQIRRRGPPTHVGRPAGPLFLPLALQVGPHLRGSVQPSPICPATPTTMLPWSTATP